jgi:peroxiredoxin
MKSLRFLTVLLAVTVTCLAARAGTPCNPYTLSLKQTDGHPYALRTPAGHRGTVFVFLLTDCPASQSYTLTLNTLYKEYASRGIRMIGVIPGTFSTPDEISEFISTYHVAFPVVTDPAKDLVRCLQATLAPECFLVDHAGTTVYSGRIDDWLVALGKKKIRVTTHDLRDAMAALLNGKPVNVKHTHAVGCIIE